MNMPVKTIHKKTTKNFLALCSVCLFLFACVQNQFVQRKKQLCHYFWPIDTDTYMNAIDNNTWKCIVPVEYNLCKQEKKLSSIGSRGWLEGKIHEIYAPAFGGHLLVVMFFYRLIFKVALGPLLLRSKSKYTMQPNSILSDSKKIRIQKMHIC